MKAYTYNDRLVGVGNDQILGTDQGGGATYTAGQYISIDENDVISVTGLAPVSAIPDVSDMATKTWVGQQGYLTEIPSTYATDTEVYNATVTAIDAATAVIPDTEDVTFEEIDLSNYALASAIPDTSDMATQTWVGNQGYLTSVPSTYATDTEVYNAVVTGIQTATGLIPDVSDMATQTWVGNQGYLVPSITRSTAYGQGAVLYNGTGATIGTTAAKVKLNLSSMLSSYSVANWSVTSTKLDLATWEVKVSAILVDVIGSQWQVINNAVTVTSGHIASGPHLFPCFAQWAGGPAIQIVTDSDWTQSMSAIIRDVRNSSGADNNALHINLDFVWYNL